MKKLLQVISVLSVCLLASNAALAAKVQMKNGQVIEGAIQGLIVQRGKVEKSPSKDNPSKTVYSTRYSLTNGVEIVAIDEQGLHKEGNRIVFIRVRQEDTPLDDLDVVETGINAPETPFSMTYTKAGGLVSRVSGRSSQSSSIKKEELLGEYRVNPETKKAQLIPAIEILTDKGIVKVPVNDIVEFK